MTQLAQKFEIHIPVESDEDNAVDLLSIACELSKQRIKQTMKNGAVWLTHNEHTSRLRRAKRKLEKGDELHLYFDESVQSAIPETPELIADEVDYSVFFKPQGMFSQGSKWGDHCTINRWVEQNMDRPAFVVHRLDRAATGLIIIAHTKTAAAALSKLFEQRSIDKKYRARVIGRFEPNSIVLDDDIDGRKALSRVTFLQYDEANNCSLLEINIETGRKHQIRRHLAGVDFPIIGDRLYGRADAPSNDASVLNDESSDSDESALTPDLTPDLIPDLQLVATELSFVNPLSAKEIEAIKNKQQKNIWGNSSDDSQIANDKKIETIIASSKKTYSVPDRLLASELRKPQVDNPEVSNPEIDTSQKDTSQLDSPPIETPQIDNPWLKMSKVDKPKSEEIEPAKPVVDTPEADKPELDEPSVKKPSNSIWPTS